MLKLIQSMLSWTLRNERKNQKSSLAMKSQNLACQSQSVSKLLGYDQRKLIKQIRRHEGERLKPYLCTAQKLTIGVGRNLDDRGISKQESKYLLMNDIKAVEDALVVKLPWFDTLDDVRKRVLIDMGFNLGIGGLLGFKDTLRYVSEGKYSQASRSMLMSLWADQVGQRAETLSRMMETGEDPDFLC